MRGSSCTCNSFILDELQIAHYLVGFWLAICSLENASLVLGAGPRQFVASRTRELPDLLKILRPVARDLITEKATDLQLALLIARFASADSCISLSQRRGFIYYYLPSSRPSPNASRCSTKISRFCV